MMMVIAITEKGEKKMGMRDYEDMKDIVIPKEQEEMMNVICDAWDECRSLESCKDCPDRPEKFMRMAMCTALKYTRKLIEAGYTKQPTADVQEVSHNYWKWICDDIDGRSLLECQRCGDCFWQTIEKPFGFCPGCGAKLC